MQARRFILGLTIAVIASVGLSLTGGSAQAAERGPAHAAPAWHPAQPTHGTNTVVPDVQTNMASSYCGSWLRGPMYCVNFSRSEQKWLSGISLTAATSAICAASLGIGCPIAGAVAYGLQRYVDSHGLCPLAHPVLEVEYAPNPGGHISCSNG